MYLVAFTSPEFFLTSWVYLHADDRRMQLSPVVDDDVLLPTLDDARHALALAEDFLTGTDVPYYATITGPDGEIQSQYRGPADDMRRHALVAAHTAGTAAWHR